MKKHIFFENLDGLRFLCFLSVFFFHSFYTEYEVLTENTIYIFIKNTLFGNGNLGVNFFFVLSGFLITYLLIEEKKLNKQISLKNFWIRRILRIWPLFFICVFYGFLIFPMLKQLFGQVPNENANLIYFITFTNNFDFIYNGKPDASNLGVLWSVAIEEQFYLIWPVVVYFFSIKKMWIPFLIIISSSLVFRAMNDSYLFHEYHTLSCIGDMAIGAIGAWLVIISPKFKDLLLKLSKIQIGIIYLLFIVAYFFRKEVFLEFYSIRIFERLIIAIIIIFVILEQTFATKSFFKMSNFKWISNLGIITYGLYCLHFIGILIAINITKIMKINESLWVVIIVETSLGLLITIIISKISFKYIESPFLKLKKRFSFITKE